MSTYTALVDRVHDGDTFHATIKVPGGLGASLSIDAEVRLSGINSPELTGVNAAAGEAATIGLMGLLGFIPDGKRHRGVFNIPGDYFTANPVTVQLVTNDRHEREKYGRVLARVMVGGVDVCAGMVNNGWAVIMLRVELDG